MGHPRESGRIDWGLFLLVTLGAQGFYGFMPFEYSQRDQINYALAGALLAILVILKVERALNAVWSSPLILFIVAWSVAAALTSPRPGSSLFVAMVLIMMIAYTSQRQSTNEQTLQTFALAATVSMIPSIVGRVTPLLGVPVFEHSGSAGGYAGYFPANSWSGMCAAATLLSIATLVVNSSFVWWYLPAVAVGLFLLVLTKSATSIVSCIVALGVLAGVTAWRRTSARFKPLIILGSGTAVLLAALTLGNRIDVFTTLAGATGRDEKFSNRTDIWAFAGQQIAEAPLWGHGSGFWKGALQQTTGVARFGSAQSGFLEYALAFGIPAALTLGVLVIRSGYRLAIASSPMLPLWTFGVLQNVSNSQVAIPGIASLSLWLAIAAASRNHVGNALQTATAPDDQSIPKAIGSAARTGDI